MTWFLIVANVLIFLVLLPITLPSTVEKVLLLKLDAPAFPGLITSIFLHADWEHLTNNMVALYLLGKIVERQFKPLTYLLVYLGCGICGDALQVFMHRHLGGASDAFSLGASGAISGLGGVALVLAPSTAALYVEGSPFRGRGPADALAWQLGVLLIVGVMLVVDLGLASQIDRGTYQLVSIGVYAHFGGWLSGATIGALTRFRTRGRGEYAKALGMRQIRAGDWWDGAESFELAERILPNDPEVAYWRARCFQMTGDAKEALRCLDKAIHLYELRGNITRVDALRKERTNLVAARLDVPRIKSGDDDKTPTTSSDVGDLGPDIDIGDLGGDI